MALSPQVPIPQKDFTHVCFYYGDQGCAFPESSRCVNLNWFWLFLSFEYIVISIGREMWSMFGSVFILICNGSSPFTMTTILTSGSRQLLFFLTNKARGFSCGKAPALCWINKAKMKPLPEFEVECVRVCLKPVFPLCVSVWCCQLRRLRNTRRQIVKSSPL